MMKKFSSILLVVMLAFSALLTACSGSNGTTAPNDSKGNGEKNNTDQQEPSGNEPVEIEFWYSLGGENGEIIEGMVADFNKSQDEVVVKPTFQGDYYENHTKVLAAVAAGNQPAVTMVEIASIGAFADQGVLEDLGPYSNGFEDKYIPGLMGNSYWEEKLYAVPFNRSTPIMYFNRDMVKEAGLDPAGPKTWDELKEYANALTKKEGGETKVYGYSAPIDIWFYEAMVFESGGKILSEDGKELALNNEAGKEALNLWLDMLKDGSMRTPPGEKYNAWDVAKQDFINGNIAMTYLTTGWLKMFQETAEFDVGAGFLPANESYGVPTGGTNLAMLSKASDEEKEAAWKFMQWMTDTEQTIQWSKGSGYMPVTTDALSSDEMKAFYAEYPNFEVAVDQLEYAKPRPMVPGYKELQEVIMNEVKSAVLGKSTVDEALQNATEKAERILK